MTFCPLPSRKGQQGAARDGFAARELSRYAPQIRSNRDTRILRYANCTVPHLRLVTHGLAYDHREVVLRALSVGT